MYSLLKSIAQEPVSARQGSGSGGSALSKELRGRLISMHATSFDHLRGGLRMPVKFLDRDSVEYSLVRASLGDDAEAHMARLTLIRSLALVDPVDGGVRSYSSDGWMRPSVHKNIATQTGHLRLYALGFAFWRYDALRRALWQIRNYLLEHCTRDSVFVESAHAQQLTGTANTQVAPVRARENGWAIEALASSFEFAGDGQALTMSLQAAAWIADNLQCAGGGFRASTDARQGRQLAASLSMGRAMLQLYRTTSDNRWIKCSIRAANFVNRRFRHGPGGYLSSLECHTPELNIDENIALARYANLLTFYTKDKCHREIAEHAMRYLVQPEIATARIEEAGILLADHELRHTPRRIVITGGATDPRAKTSFLAALRRFGWYKCLHWPGREHAAEQALADLSPIR